MNKNKNDKKNSKQPQLLQYFVSVLACWSVCSVSICHMNTLTFQHVYGYKNIVSCYQLLVERVKHDFSYIAAFGTYENN